mmetsp:Transcript_34558/g.83790  ORF Transcript_34558/g.83790 Transcript_34558/m.83790 type:complete len:562 (-) Transcript_34558:65-1750(-)
MEFVTSLDGIAFKLAENGYLRSAGEETARVVTSTSLKGTKKWRWLNRWAHVIMIVGLYSLWGYVSYRQSCRDNGDNEIYIQFTDAIVPWLGTLSGTYVGTHLSYFGLPDSVGVIVYENEHQKRYCEDNGTPGCKQGIFFYCQNVKEWHLDVVESTDDLSCDHRIVRGLKDEPKLKDMYDILTYSSSKWFARNPKEDQTALSDTITMIKSPKTSQYLRNGQEYDTLESSGVLFDHPYYRKMDGGPRIHDRPVYTAFDGKNGEFLAFNGYRWIAVKYNDHECTAQCKYEVGAGGEDCVQNCLLTFYPFYSDYVANLISAPMEVQTSEDTWVPSSALVWYKAREKGNETQPDIELKGLPVHVSEALEMLVADGYDDDDGLKDESAKAKVMRVFAESSRLSKSTTSQQCRSDETSFVIDLRTDLYPDETSMIVMDMNEESFSLPSSLQDFAELVDQRFGGKEFLTESDFFSWDKSTPRVFNLYDPDGKRPTPERITTYRYATCLPQSSCAGVLLHDAYSDAIFEPGKFDLYLNSTKALFDGVLKKKNYCLYQLGPKCDNAGVKCA